MKNPLPLSGHVYLIDDHEDIRFHLSESLRRFGLTVEAFADAQSFLSQAVEVSPAVLVIDMVLPKASGLDLYKTVKESGWGCPIIFISGKADGPDVVEVMKMGVEDFLWKPFSITKLIDTIEGALRKDLKRIESQVQDMHISKRWSTLTAREREICRYLLQGYGNNAIASMLDIQPDTAKKHRTKVMEKLGATNLPELIALPLANFLKND